MTRTTRNGAAAALATDSIMAANNVPEVSQHAKVAETLNEEATEQTDVGASHSKNVQNTQKCIDIDSKVDAIIVDYENNCKALVAALVQNKLNERIKVLEAKKAQVTFEAKLCSLKQESVQGYLKANIFMGDPPKYNGKSMRHYKVYKYAVEYMFGERLFTYCTNKKKCTYTGQFLTGISAEHWEIMKTKIKKSSTLEFDYKAFMEMLKERLLSQKVHQIKVGTKLKSLREKDSQILSKFNSHFKALERNIEPPLTNAQKH
ncbi:hypothetical protein MMC22_008374 [Lobaria immixta]|nr:hypothetical protein [Lobaria immixta]